MKKTVKNLLKPKNIKQVIIKKINNYGDLIIIAEWYP